MFEPKITPELSAMLTLEIGESASFGKISIVPSTTTFSGPSPLINLFIAAATASVLFIFIKIKAAATPPPINTTAAIIIPTISPTFFFFLGASVASAAFCIGRPVGSSDSTKGPPSTSATGAAAGAGRAGCTSWIVCVG